VRATGNQPPASGRRPLFAALRARS